MQTAAATTNAVPTHTTANFHRLARKFKYSKGSKVSAIRFYRKTTLSHNYTQMSRTAAVISFLAPLALTPHLLFYYDVTPKIAVLFAGAAVAFLLAAFHLDSL